MKKVIALMLVMLLAFSLVGCKSKGYIDDEEIAVAAGDKTQVDINETEKTETTEQTKENEDTSINAEVEATDKTESVVSEQSDKTGDNQATENTTNKQKPVDNTGDSTTNEEITTEKKVNQLELEHQPRIEEDPNDWWLTFNSVADFVTALKTKKYIDITPEKDRVNNSKYEWTQNKINLDLQKGIETDYRFDLWNTDKIEYFYKIKDFSGYTLKQVSIAGDASIECFYYPISSDKSTYDKKLEIAVSYRRVDTIITDSYFDDFLEYYGNDNLTEDGFIFNLYEKSGFAIIMFPVENTIIQITGRGDMANYDALKKLCVAEKVVVK